MTRVKMLLSPQFQDSQMEYYCKDINVALQAEYGHKENSILIKTKAHNIPRSKSGHPQPEATITCCYQRPEHLKSDHIQKIAFHAEFKLLLLLLLWPQLLQLLLLL